MAVRENKKEIVLKNLAEKLCAAIRSMEDGKKESIGHLVSRYYTGKGYELCWLDGMHGKGWTKDNRKSFSVCDKDLFEILDMVSEELYGEIELDYSEYENTIVGLLYNLWFTIKRVK